MKIRVTIETLEQTTRGKLWRRIFEQVVDKREGEEEDVVVLIQDTLRSE